jgi:hypothetical protein
MGGGRWDDDRYTRDTHTRASTKTPDFAYTTTATSIHANLDPKRINSKPFGKLESRDSAEHPDSNAVLVCFDVTGSNFTRAVDAQKKLPNLMNLLEKYIPDPQVAVGANDDFTVVGEHAIQLSDFESDNRIDEHIRNTWLVRNGGGNDGESYDLLLYAAARKTVLDCFEKRGRKGYFFMYADEPIFKMVEARHVKAIFGDNLQHDIPTEEIIEEAKKRFHVFVIWPEGGYTHARTQYVRLFGEECVVTLQHPNLICELIGSLVGLNEEKVAPADITNDLVAVGTSHSDATALTTALVPFANKHFGLAKSSGDIPTSAKKGADRL